MFLICVDSECMHVQHTIDEPELLACEECAGVALMYTDNYWLNKKSSVAHARSGVTGASLEEPEHTSSGADWMPYI